MDNICKIFLMKIKRIQERCDPAELFSDLPLRNHVGLRHLGKNIMSSEHKKRVFLATVSGLQSFTYDALKDSLSVSVVTTTSQAHAVLAQPFDVIICGSKFDESRMFDLLRYCKAMPHLRNVPFVCVRARGGELDDAAYQGVAIALRTLQAEAFIDLYRWKKSFGAEKAREMLRDTIRRLASNRRTDTQFKVIQP
jgi:hypothetical protein